MDATEELLKERSKTHGDFTDHARITQSLKKVVRVENGFEKLNNIQVEAIDMIFHKIGRILSGNPNHHDHWDDIAGYAKLVSKRIPNA
jgi:Domain of unknown function (DUF6378)